MKSKWKYIVSGFLFLIIVAPTLYYLASLDWQYKHSNKTNSLPYYKPGSADGIYRIKVNNFEFRARMAGMDNKGPALILLHGFPASSASWVPLIPSLAKAGYRVIAYDQRGYSPGARPFGKDAYKINKLSRDIFDIADTLGIEKFHLAGHDWGAGVGWYTAMNAPDRLLSWAALSIPHFGSFLKSANEDPEQSKRSGYFKFLKTPVYSEFLMTINRQKAVRGMYSQLPEEIRDEYLAILSEPMALTSALNWYRAIDIEGVSENLSLQKPVTVPTLFIWGTKDGVVAESSVARARKLMPTSYKELAFDAGHGITQEIPELLVPALLEFLRNNAS